MPATVAGRSLGMACRDGGIWQTRTFEGRVG
jgi:hypothetical protein